MHIFQNKSINTIIEYNHMEQVKFYLVTPLDIKVIKKSFVKNGTNVFKNV